MVASLLRQGIDVADDVHPKKRDRQPRRLGRFLLGFGQGLRFVLRLRVADGLRQHLSKFGLGLCLFARPRFPCRHEDNMGMRAVKLKHPRKRWGRFRKVVS
jgi:hypothetical protein